MSGIVGSKLNIRGSGLVASYGTDGQHLLSAGPGVSNVFETVAAGGNTPAFHVTLGSNQTSLSDDSWTKITLDTEIYDSDGTFASNKWTPASAAKYFVYGVGTSFGAGDGMLDNSIALYKNGSGFMYGYEGGQSNQVSTNDPQTRMVAGIFDLDADDYIELYTRIDVASSTGTVQADYTFMGGFKVG